MKEKTITPLNKLEEIREIIHQKAQAFWKEAIEIGFIVSFDRIKVYIENQIEKFYQIPNMWVKNFLEEVSLSSIKSILSFLDIDDMLIACKGCLMKVEEYVTY